MLASDVPGYWRPMAITKTWPCPLRPAGLLVHAQAGGDNGTRSPELSVSGFSGAALNHMSVTEHVTAARGMGYPDWLSGAPPRVRGGPWRRWLLLVTQDARLE